MVLEFPSNTLVLIEELSANDLLAKYIKESVQGTDEVYFYDRSINKIWKDRRNYSTYIELDDVVSADRILIIIGNPKCLLEIHQIKPSEYAFETRDKSKNLALMQPASTANWGLEERSLMQCCPVIPMTQEGINSLEGQWESKECTVPNSAEVPDLDIVRYAQDWTHRQDIPKEDALIQNLKWYLTREGFATLASVASLNGLDYGTFMDKSKLNGNETLILRILKLKWFREGWIDPRYVPYLQNWYKENVNL